MMMKTVPDQPIGRQHSFLLWVTDGCFHGSNLVVSASTVNAKSGPWHRENTDMACDKKIRLPIFPLPPAWKSLSARRVTGYRNWR